MKYLRPLLFPFSLVYALLVIIRNWCYDAGIFKSAGFTVPIISVGNIEVGGAGKSPMTEYLVRLFKDKYKLATLSRGYGRQTNGYLVADATTTAAQIGDEPAQFKHKFPDITVAVCEDRVAGIERLLPAHNLIVLDDAYQHRAVKPGLSILLFDYSKVNNTHLLLPAGDMREPFYGRKRADILIISKCPAALTIEEQNNIIQWIKPFAHQTVYFTAITYLALQDMKGKSANNSINPDTTVFLLTGIANAQPLIKYLQKQTPHIIHYNYPDHHRFSLKNITKLADEFAACSAQNKIIITTEKDAQRLWVTELQAAVAHLPFLVLPIGISFLSNGQQQFDRYIINYVREYTEHH